MNDKPKSHTYLVTVSIGEGCRQYYQTLNVTTQDINDWFDSYRAGMKEAVAIIFARSNGE